jgi:hypothetical protein
MSPSLFIEILVLSALVLMMTGSSRAAAPAATQPATEAPSATDNVRPLEIEDADANVLSATAAGPTPYLPGILGGFESYYSPRLKKMRDEYNPGAAMEGAKTELEKILRLRHWVHSQFPIDDTCSFPYEDPFDILEEAKKTGRGFYCAHYEVVAHCVYSAYGFASRMVYCDVDYTKQPKGAQHAINEVYCNELGKWIAIDCKWDNHFERGGVPLSALETMEAVRKDGGKGVDRCWGFDKKQPADQDETQCNIRNYYWVGYWLRSDLITQAHWWLNNDFTTRFVVWDTPSTRASRWPRMHDHNNLIYEPDRHQLDWTPNVPKFFQVRRLEGNKLWVRLLSATPNFKEYSMRIDGGPWQTVPGKRGALTWPLHGGENTLDCRARNLWEMDGAVVTMRVEVKSEK